jgi:hypothetical protein
MCTNCKKKNKSVGTDNIMNPGLNPNCASVKMAFSSLHFNNRELINEVKSFPTWETNEIPR